MAEPAIMTIDGRQSDAVRLSGEPLPSFLPESTIVLPIRYVIVWLPLRNVNDRLRAHKPLCSMDLAISERKI